jgi:spore germination protein GerM
MRRAIFPLTALVLAILACITPGAQVPTATIPSASVTLTVYFTDIARYEYGTEPYEAAVTRTGPAPASLPEAVLKQLFLGPTDTEVLAGLEVILSGTTGFSNLAIENGVARVYLSGACASQGSTYTIANLIFANLKQFPEIKWIKIYDQNGETETPDGQNSSIPLCLEP